MFWISFSLWKWDVLTRFPEVIVLNRGLTVWVNDWSVASSQCCKIMSHGFIPTWQDISCSRWRDKHGGLICTKEGAVQIKVLCLFLATSFMALACIISLVHVERHLLLLLLSVITVYHTSFLISYFQKANSDTFFFFLYLHKGAEH